MIIHRVIMIINIIILTIINIIAIITFINIILPMIVIVSDYLLSVRQLK